MATSRELEFRVYERAHEKLLSLIHAERLGTRTASSRRKRAVAKLSRTRALLSALGNPERHVPVIHVTGTSGKGSTSAAIAAILTAAGYRVGLRTSPYLQASTEKLQIGRALIDAASFDALVTDVLDVAGTFASSRSVDDQIGYAEAWTCMAMLWFAERAVDFAVVEVGAGGRFDSTNAVRSAVSVITSVGFDHVVSLGPSLVDIAWHKAGIIKPGSIAVVGDVPPEARAVIEAEARSTGATVRHVAEGRVSNGWPIAMRGEFQQINARTAVAAVDALGRLGICIPDSAFHAGLAATRLPGRLEPMPRDGLANVWIDGAHNVDKITALRSELDRLVGSGPQPVVVLGLLGSKDGEGIVTRLAAAASTIVTTQTEVVGKRARDARDLAADVRKSGFLGQVIVERDPARAVTLAEDIAATEGSSVVVTGSLYLVGAARSRWYPNDEIVLQRTPWPSLAERSRSGALSGLSRLVGHEPDYQRKESPDKEIFSSIDEEPVGLQR